MKPLVSGFGLPAAMVTVTVQNPNDSARRRKLDGIVDTGADVTLIPQRLARQIGVRSHTRMTISGVEGYDVARPAYIVNLEFAETKLERRAVGEWNGKFIVLGRDVLSDFVFVYDGKTRRFEIRDP